jgi:hypothetical protein
VLAYGMSPPTSHQPHEVTGTTEHTVATTTQENNIEDITKMLREYNLTKSRQRALLF